MSTYHVLVNDRELEFMQRDIINDFLKVEGGINLDIEILVAKLSLIVKFMKTSRHKSLKDFEFIYQRFMSQTQEHHELI